MNPYSTKTDHKYTNKLLSGIHASSQLSESSSLYNTYNIRLQNNEDENDSLNIELISKVHKKYGEGNFASLFLNNSNSKITPYQPFPTGYVAKKSSACEEENFYKNGLGQPSNGQELRSICKVLTISKPLKESFENQNSQEIPLKRMSNKIFSGSSLDMEESASTDTAPNSDAEDSLDHEESENTLTSFENLLINSEAPDENPTNSAKDPTIERLLKMVAERDEEIVNLRQQYSELNNFIKSLPTREQLSEQMREKIISEMKANDSEFQKVKIENEALRARLSEMESFHHQKDKLIQDTMTKQLEQEQEIGRLNMALKDMEMKVEAEAQQKQQLSLEYAKVQKEEREKGRLDSLKLCELERIDKIQLESQVGQCVSKIKALEDALHQTKSQLKCAKDEEHKAKKIIHNKETEIGRYKNEIVNLKSLVLVSKTNNTLIDTYKAKLEDLTHQLENEKMLNQTNSVLTSLADSTSLMRNERDNDNSEDLLRKGIDAIVDKIKVTGKSVDVEHICDNMFKVQGKIVQLKLIGNKVCALRNNTPFPLELFLLN